ncbi:MAG: energy transducer TonB [Parafilimonas sp.]
MSQSRNESFYAFKEDWSAAQSIDSCFYFMHEIKKNDTEYVCRYYNKFGPMVKQEVYRDEALSIPNGFFCWYNEKGKIDSCGWVLNLRKDGRWSYFIGDSTKETYADDYDNGKFLKREVNLPADTTQREKDATQKEAVFRHGSNSWLKYIYANINVPDRLTKNLGEGKYVVTVSFVVNKTGKVENVFLLKSVEWSADAEVFKIVETSPDWQPAIQLGKPVKYRQREDITFSVEK